MRIGALKLTSTSALSVALKRALTVVGVALCCFAGTTQTTQQDYKQMKGMLAGYTWGGALSVDTASKKLTNLVDMDYAKAYITLNEEASELLDKKNLEALIKNRLETIGIKLEEPKLLYDSFFRERTDYRSLVDTDRLFSTVEFSVDIGESHDIWFYVVSLRVTRAAYIRPGYFTHATVWKREAYGILGKGHRQSEIRELFRNALRDYLEEFEADWRLANRK